jgi:hypothetical protein
MDAKAEDDPRGSTGLVQSRFLWPKQSLDRPTFIHGTVSLSHLLKWKREIKDFSGIYFACPHQIDQLGQVPAHWSGPAVEVNVLEEQFLAVQFDAVRDADVTDVTPGASRMDGLHH